MLRGQGLWEGQLSPRPQLPWLVGHTNSRRPTELGSSLGRRGLGRNSAPLALLRPGRITQPPTPSSRSASCQLAARWPTGSGACAEARRKPFRSWLVTEPHVGVRGWARLPEGVVGGMRREPACRARRWELQKPDDAIGEREEGQEGAGEGEGQEGGGRGRGAGGSQVRERGRKGGKDQGPRRWNRKGRMHPPWCPMRRRERRAFREQSRSRSIPASSLRAA